MGENIIEIAGLRKSFDHVEVVKGVDMQVHQGEFLTCWGPPAAVRPPHCG